VASALGPCGWLGGYARSAGRRVGGLLGHGRAAQAGQSSGTGMICSVFGRSVFGRSGVVLRSS
jgi:hypothetical protein